MKSETKPPQPAVFQQDGLLKRMQAFHLFLKEGHAQPSETS